MIGGFILYDVLDLFVDCGVCVVGWVIFCGRFWFWIGFDILVGLGVGGCFVVTVVAVFTIVIVILFVGASGGA